MNKICNSLLFEYPKLLLILFILIFLPVHSFSKILTRKRAETFIQILLEEKSNLEEFVLPQELELSHRFNISYTYIKYKFLISYNIDPIVKKRVIKNQIPYEISINELQNDLSCLEFYVPEMNYKRNFYFKEKYLISPIYFYTSGWKKIESEHFIFMISDSTLFNPYCIMNLEKFFNKISSELNLSIKQIENIRSQKIYYYLCKNEDEIEKLTGFRTRGIYNLAYDYLITTYNNHYHELMHLLINLKLQQLPLYTHPFFQEGFAVAFGGRGGKEPKVILDLGIFLHRSDMLHYSSLMSKKGFYKVDVSLSYPLSGLYNYFLIKEIGIESYLYLYLKYSGSAEMVNKMIISKEDLPSDSKWESFLDSYSNDNIIFLECAQNDFHKIYHEPSIRVSENQAYYFFQIKDTLLILTGNHPEGYKSKKFIELFKDQKYQGEKYLITANSDEVAIFNLFTNNLIADFVSSFSIPMKLVPGKDGFFEFYVLKSLFDESLTEILKQKKTVE